MVLSQLRRSDDQSNPTSETCEASSDSDAPGGFSKSLVGDQFSWQHVRRSGERDLGKRRPRYEEDQSWVFASGRIGDQ